MQNKKINERREQQRAHRRAFLSFLYCRVSGRNLPFRRKKRGKKRTPIFLISQKKDKKRGLSQAKKGHPFSNRNFMGVLFCSLFDRREKGEGKGKKDTHFLIEILWVSCFVEYGHIKAQTTDQSLRDQIDSRIAMAQLHLYQTEGEKREKGKEKKGTHFLIEILWMSCFDSPFSYRNFMGVLFCPSLYHCAKP